MIIIIIVSVWRSHPRRHLTGNEAGHARGHALGVEMLPRRADFFINAQSLQNARGGHPILGLIVKFFHQPLEGAEDIATAAGR